MRVAPDVIAKLLKHDKPIHEVEWVLDPETGQVDKINQAPLRQPAATFQSSHRTSDYRTCPRPRSQTTASTHGMIVCGARFSSLAPALLAGFLRRNWLAEESVRSVWLTMTS
jgi:hypothetical protein